jgi:hypothetical protein
MSKVPTFNKVNQIVSIVLLILPLVLMTRDVQEKWQFRKIEMSLASGQIEQTVAIDHLSTLALEMKVRQYLDYTGRQLSKLGEC